MKIIFELPFYSNTCGGVLSTISLAKEMGAELRFQRLTNEMPVDIGVKFTVGKTEMFPACDWAISYSDNPFFARLFNVRRVKRVGIFMQSYGMSIVQERKNALNKKALVLCTTKKIEDAIKADGGNVHRIGHGFDLQHFYDKKWDRENYLAIMYHHMETKQYDVAVKVADVLYDDGVIDGVITFGMSDGYSQHKHPKGLVLHYSHADKDGVSEVFNQCKAYLMPSISEGLNLTPIEATLCGCPSVICDGAIGDIFIDRYNCLVVNNSTDEMFKAVKSLIEDFNAASYDFMIEMKSIIAEIGSWDDVAYKLNELL
jgi:hypothetical protein